MGNLKNSAEIGGYY